jgi:membrane associated rhomboid family serine protease
MSIQMAPIRLTPAVKFFLISCVAMFVLQQGADRFFGANLLGWLALVPSGFVMGLKVWQIFTYVFLHGDVSHLLLNMLMLAFVGGELEVLWGTRRFLQYFFTCSTAAGLLYLFFQLLLWRDTGLNQPLVGASGGIFGLLVAYGLIYAERTLLFMMIFPMKARHFVLVLAGVEFLSTIFAQTGGGVLSGIAHLGGMGAGFISLWLKASAKLRARTGKSGGGFGLNLPGKSKKKTSAAHLKLVVNQKDRPKGKGDGDSDGPGGSGNPPVWH